MCLCGTAGAGGRQDVRRNQTIEYIRFFYNVL